MITGRLLSFDEAHAMGLVNEVWDETRLSGRAFSDASTTPGSLPRPTCQPRRGTHQASRAVGSRVPFFWRGSRSSVNCSSYSSRARTHAKGLQRTSTSVRPLFRGK